MSRPPVSAGAGAQTSAGETSDPKQTDDANEVLDLVERWRARVDEIRVQLDLAKLDLRDQANRQLELASNANAAAASRLRDAYRDATATAEALENGVEALVKDVKEAFNAVQDVLERD